ncbi:hypothetical protein ACLB2K_001069 [Fragaria x ananassa]
MFASNPTMFSAYASFAASMMLLRSITDQLIPAPLQTYIYSFLRRLFTPLSTTLTLVIDEHTGLIARNEVFDAAELYLRTKTSSLTNRLRVCKTPKKKTISSAIDKNQELVDTFENMKLTWQFVCIEPTKGGTYSYEKRHYELSFHKKHKEKVMECYLPYVLATAKSIKENEKVLKLYTLDRDENSRGSGLWKSIGLEHPSTFDTVAMEPEMKKRIVGDLDRFVRRKEFYKKVGKAWKRGYLLYGPPGTGKSSLIAAMANYLKFSIFDLELSSLSTNCELRKALLSTSNRSILVIEDIDCSVEIQNREAGEGASKNNKSNKMLTLSGLLNFIDGLWSSCGDERIIVFTTNHKDRLDPALLRPGRMDMHINLSYCTAGAFSILASNYLGIHRSNRHRLYGEIEGLIEGSEVTPAEVAEELLKIDDAEVALEGLLSLLKRKKVERDQAEEGSNKAEIQEEAENLQLCSELLKISRGANCMCDRSYSHLHQKLASKQTTIQTPIHICARWWML